MNTLEDIEKNINFRKMKFFLKFLNVQKVTKILKISSESQKNEYFRRYRKKYKF